MTQFPLDFKSKSRFVFEGSTVLPRCAVVDTLAALVEVAEILIPFDRILGPRERRSTMTKSFVSVSIARMEFHYDEGIPMAAGTGTYIVG